MSNVIVVGAQPGSLGEAIADEARNYGSNVITVGVSGTEDQRLDLVHDNVRGFLESYLPDHVVCTAGINRPRGDLDRDGLVWWGDHLFTNVVGPMRLLEAFTHVVGLMPSTRVSQFVAISSNSAHIPRTGSGPYCASKAALSMALRVAAREAAREDGRYIVYGYEPGLIAGTPMTSETEARLPGVPLTRMQGRGVQNGLPVRTLAKHIAHNLRHGGTELNGCLFRIDAGEL